LEHRLLNASAATGVSLDRLRRRVVFERIVARLDAAAPGQWVLKGGMALEVRLRDDARLTKDLDLGLRAVVRDGATLRILLVDALADDPDGDRFEFRTGEPSLLSPDGGGHHTWRVKVQALLAGRPFGGITLDVSPRIHELSATDRVPLPNSMAFADLPERTIEIVDINRHAAEKLHAMSRDFGERENSRVRDLVDLVLLHEHGSLDPAALAVHVRAVWAERDADKEPGETPRPRASWRDGYARHIDDLGLQTDFDAAEAMIIQLWQQMAL
jgi:hypothetical protein